MLSDRHCELLTAYVDGELETRERQAVDRLLSTSPEARQFLDRLEADSKEIHSLPARKAPDTLADSVMGTVWDTPPLRHREVPATPLPIPVPPPRHPRRVRLMVAAAVLVAVGLATFFLANRLLNDNPQTNNATADPPQAQGFLTDLLVKCTIKFADDVADEDIGVQLILADIFEEPVKQRLAFELKKEPGFWFDLPTANNKHAVDRLTEAFKASGINVLIDPAVKDKLTKKQPKVRFLLYAENLAHDEIMKVFQHVCKAEQKAVGGKSLDRIVMTGISPDKRAQVANALLVEPKLIDPSAKGLELLPLIDDAKKPMLPNNGPAEPTQRLAMLLALTADGKPSDSDALRRFMAARQGFRKGVVQLVVLIHEQPLWHNAATPPRGKMGMAAIKSRSQK